MKGMKKKDSWTISDIPSQRDRLIIITGIGGLGYETVFDALFSWQHGMSLTQIPFVKDILDLAPIW